MSIAYDYDYCQTADDVRRANSRVRKLRRQWFETRKLFDQPPTAEAPKTEAWDNDQLGIIQWTGSLWTGGYDLLVEAAYPPCYVMINGRPPRPLVRDVVACVAKVSKIRLNDLISARRTKDVTEPRQVAMALAKHLTLKSLPEIGRYVGNRDHTTVLHGCRKMQPVIDATTAIVSPNAPLEVWVRTALGMAKTVPTPNPDPRRSS